MKTNSQLLNVPEAAEFLGIAEGTLRNWRNTRRVRIPHVLIGRRVMYRRDDLIHWLNSRVIDPLPPEGAEV